MEKFLHHKNTNNGNIAVVSILHHGHLYNKYINYIDKVIHNHKTFADVNGFDYFLFNSEINDEYNLYDKDFNGPDICLGMSKWYAINHLFKNSDYYGILFVDYDSCFLKFENFKVPQHTCLSPVHGTPYYDAVFLLYYCLAKGITYKTFADNTRARKYNSGFMFIDRDFFNECELDDYVRFSKQVFYDVNKNTDTWISQGNFDYTNIMNHTNITLTPFDEVFLMYNIIKNNYEPIDIFDTETYNVNNLNKVTDKTQHIHFCTDKLQFFDYYDKH